MRRVSTTNHGRLGLATGAALAIGAALVMVPQSAAADTPDGSIAPLVRADENVVAGRYIVVLDDDASGPTLSAATATAVRAGGTVHQEYSHAIDGFAATLPAAALDAVRHDPSVDYVEPDTTVSIASTQSPATWGIDRTDQRSLPLNNTYTYGATGAGVTAYIIDTGIRNTHSEFGGRAVSGFNGTGDPLGTIDCNGHGTHVAGTVGGSTYGIAKSVRLVAVRVLNCAGSGTTSGVIAGVDWVTGDHEGASVANMSLGGGYSAALESAVAGSIASGVTYAVAAGNDSGADACASSPSGVPTAITVGSSTRTDSVSSFSNLGPCLDLFGPGSDITSAWWLTDTSTNTISGTSMATPHVAGVAALYLQGHPGAGPAQVASALTGNATTGALSGVPGGTVNRLLFSNY